MGWQCEACTFHNERDHALACEICSTERSFYEEASSSSSASPIDVDPGSASSSSSSSSSSYTTPVVINVVDDEEEEEVLCESYAVFHGRGPELLKRFSEKKAERVFVCSVCRRRQSTDLLMQTHLLRSHGEATAADLEELASLATMRALEHEDDYGEFSEMMAKLLRVKDPSDISEHRIKRWFKEADPDGSGEVSFEAKLSLASSNTEFTVCAILLTLVIFQE